MSSFTDPLVVTIEQGEEGGRGLASIASPFSYWTELYGERLTFFIPEGFVTDFCSIPRPLMPFFPVLGRAAKAGVVHDYLLRFRETWGLSRRQCDAIFREAMGVLDVPPVRRWLMWAGVRVWGALRS